MRSLTVIIGPNNSNKTYIAYSIYGLWQSAAGSTRGINKIQNLAIKQEQEGTWSITLDDQLIELFIKDIEGTAKNFRRKTLESFFQDSSRKLFSKTSFEMIISRQEVEDAINQLIQQDPFPLTDGTSLKISRKEDVLIFKIQPDDEEITTNQRPNFTGGFRQFNDRPDLVFIFSVKQLLFYNTFPFPAERNAFINTYKILETKRYRILKQKQRESFINSTSEETFDLVKESIDIRYPQPVED
ncbi:MAG: ATP-binding protein, partial [Dolichospermum sp.]